MRHTDVLFLIIECVGPFIFHIFDEYDLKQLIMKLQNPKIKITEFVSYKESKELKKRIR